jgi:hypothetical protein
VVFTTTGDVVELRRRVRLMAEMHDKHRGGEANEGMTMGGGMMDGGTTDAGMTKDGGMMGMMGGGMMPASTARAEDVEGGARLLLTPRDLDELGALRAHGRQHVSQMSSGKCPMMSMHPDAPDATAPAPSDHAAHHQKGN